MPNWRKVITSGSDAQLNSLSISNQLYDNNSQPGTSGQMIQSTGTGFTWVDNIAEASQDLIISGKNMTGTTIEKGTPLYFSGSNTSGNVVGVYPADAGDPTKMPAGGVAAESLGAGVEGDVYIYGFINGVDTSAFNSGDTIFVGVGGGYTNVKPTGSALIQKLGNVERVDATNGSGVIQGPSWYNDLPNWEEGKIKVGVSDGQPVTSSFVHLDEVNERFGIGTTSPSAKLDVVGNLKVNSNDDEKFTINGDGSGGAKYLVINTSGNGRPIVFQDNNSEVGGIDYSFAGRYLSFDVTDAGGSRVSDAFIIKSETNDNFVGIGNTSPSSKLEVTGNVAIGYTNAAPTNGMIVSGDVGIGTNSPSEKLDVQGNIKITNSILSNQQNTGVNTGTQTIATVSSTDYDGVFFDYVIKNGTNLRAGTVTAVHDGTNVSFNEVSTQDLGDTTDIELSVDLSGGDVRLLATAVSDNWTVKTILRAI